jgi:pyruvate ferredoxin oxidoreductase beta subunit
MSEQKITTAPVPFKKLAEQPELLSGGHRLCAGCAESMIVRQVLMASRYPVVVVLATGCLEVASTVYPATAWRVPVLHNAFENAAATVSGVEAAYRALRATKRVPDRDLRFIAFGGDGGTYDIGLQALSGALERGGRFLYVCLNNEGYMNTGIQRSSATPVYAETSTTPVGEVRRGKVGWRKDLTAIVVAHDIPYVAQTAPSALRPHDLKNKVARALEVRGPAFVNVLSACTRGWRYDSADTIAVTQLAIDTCYWPLFEVIDGNWHLNYKPKEKLPVRDWLAVQGRFRHLLKDERLMREIQSRIDREWEALLERCGEAGGTAAGRDPAPAPQRRTRTGSQ